MNAACIVYINISIPTPLVGGKVPAGSLSLMSDNILPLRNSSVSRRTTWIEALKYIHMWILCVYLLEERSERVLKTQGVFLLCFTSHALLC